MAVPVIPDDASTSPSLVRVEWFKREPGGGTLFVKPSQAEAPAVAVADEAGTAVE
jgi:hypothetical protein